MKYPCNRTEQGPAWRSMIPFLESLAHIRPLLEQKFVLPIPTNARLNQGQSSARIVIFKEFTTTFPILLWCGQVLRKSQFVHQSTFLSGKSSTKVLDLPQKAGIMQRKNLKEREKSFSFSSKLSPAWLCWRKFYQLHFAHAAAAGYTTTSGRAAWDSS